MIKFANFNFRTCLSCSSSCHCHPSTHLGFEAATTDISLVDPSRPFAGSLNNYQAGLGCFAAAEAVAVCLLHVFSQFEGHQCCCSDRRESNHLEEKLPIDKRRCVTPGSETTNPFLPHFFA